MFKIDYKKLNSFVKLGRYNSQIGTYLFIIPSCWGILLGTPQVYSLYTLSQIGLFSFGCFNVRSAGCIANDYLDRNFDNKVERTKNRPIANKEISKFEALSVLGIHILLGIWCLKFITIKSLYLSLYFIPFIFIYPLAKRYTYYPQLILGSVINAGVLVAGLNSLELNIYQLFPFYFSGILWTLIYDTIYGHQDIKDDLKIGVKSLAIKWGNNTIKNTKILNYIITISFFYGGYLNELSLYYYPIILSYTLIMNNMLNNCDLKNTKNAYLFFHNNKLIGLYILLAILIGKIFKKKKIN